MEVNAVSGVRSARARRAASGSQRSLNRCKESLFAVAAVCHEHMSEAMVGLELRPSSAAEAPSERRDSEHKRPRA